jgi:hypothetical protein
MKWKLEFPRFFVTVEDLAARVRQPDAPVCKGSVRFLGEWPPEPPKPADDDPIRLTARFGTTWDGFYLGYELTGEAPASLYGRTRLSVSDLRSVRIRYTDDQIEADRRRTVPATELIELLRRPENRVRDDFGCIIPGGEMLQFSRPLKALMFRGAEARAALLARLEDPAIRNEVVLALGAVGDEATVPELISRYPRGPVQFGDRAAVLTRVCFSFALCWLTAEPIDRSREGTNLGPDDAGKWEAWWAANRNTFRVSPVKPYATWVPSYPVLTPDHVARIRRMFAGRGDDRSFEYE